MSIEQGHAEFEAWAASIGFCVTGKYAETIDVLCAESAFKAGYQAGRAALHSHDREDAATEATGGDENVGHHLVEPDHETAMALADAPRSLRNYVAALRSAIALQSQDREDAERYRRLRKGNIDDVAVVQGLGAMDYGASAVIATYSYEIDGDDLDAAIDHARRIEEEL